MCNKISDVIFLFDTGAFSIFLPLCDYDANKKKTHSQFATANGTPIKCQGKTDLEINIEFRKTTATFHIGAIKQLILGFHFIKQNGLTLEAQSDCSRCSDAEMKAYAIPMSVKACEDLPVHESEYIGSIRSLSKLNSAILLQKARKA